MKTYKTTKGTELPLLNLRGKDYLQVAHRLVWFREEHPDWAIETEFISFSETDAFARATVKDALGRTITTSHKYEDQKGFPDFREKSETGAIGRALALLGYGTQFCADELEEGDRLADSPVTSVKARENRPQSTKAPQTCPVIPSVWEGRQRAKEQSEITSRVNQSSGAEMAPDRPAALTAHKGDWIVPDGKFKGKMLSAIKPEDVRNYLGWMQKNSKGPFKGWVKQLEDNFLEYTGGTK